MEDYGLQPQPAQWALSAGLPAPKKDEGFIEYVERLGMDASELLVELHEQTICLANYRLNTQLQRQMRDAFDVHVEELAAMHLDEARRWEVRHNAAVLWGGQCRPGPVV